MLLVGQKTRCLLICGLLIIYSGSSFSSTKAKSASVLIGSQLVKSPMVEFAQQKLQARLDSSFIQSKIRTISLIKDVTVPEQGFELITKQQSLILKASDDHGFMYGLLEIKEQLSFGVKLENISAVQQPHFKKRGLKFNIPLDARTPFYVPESNDPDDLLNISYDRSLKGEHRHERLNIETPDAGEYLLEVHEENGVLINSYHNRDNGVARWEWFQEQQKGIYYLNLKWRNINKVIKVDWNLK